MKNPYAELRYKERTGNLPPVNKPKTGPKLYKLVYLPDGRILTTNAPYPACVAMRNTYTRMANRYKVQQFSITRI